MCCEAKNEISSTFVQLIVHFLMKQNEKSNIHYIDAELAGHLHKLDVKLQSLSGNCISLFAVRVLAKSYHCGVNWPTTLCKNKNGVHFFTLIFECHNRYNKLLLCNSENGDIACCNKNNSVGFCVFLKKEHKPVSFQKEKQKNSDKEQKNRWVVFF